MTKTKDAGPWRQLATRVAYLATSILVAVGLGWAAAVVYARWYEFAYKLNGAQLTEDYALGFHMLLISVGVAVVVLLAAGIMAVLKFGTPHFGSADVETGGR